MHPPQKCGYASAAGLRSIMGPALWRNMASSELAPCGAAGLCPCSSLQCASSTAQTHATHFHGPFSTNDGWSPYLKSTHNEPSSVSCRGVYLTAKHSRSLTVYHALTRLGLLPSDHAGHTATTAAGSAAQDAGKQYGTNQLAWALHPDQELRVTIAGADRNEGTNAEETAARFSELTRMVAAAGVRRMRLLLAGPNISLAATAKTFNLSIEQLLGASTPEAGAPQQAYEEAAAGPLDEVPYGNHVASHHTAVSEQSGLVTATPGTLQEQQEEEGQNGVFGKGGESSDVCESPRRPGWWQGTCSSSSHTSYDGSDADDELHHEDWPLDASAASDFHRQAHTCCAEPHVHGCRLKACLKHGPVGLRSFLQRAALRPPTFAMSRNASLLPTCGQELEASAGMFKLRICYAPGLFHELDSLGARAGASIADLDSAASPPHLLACFNAGVWGYGASWLKTCTQATEVMRSHVVFTAYSREEAEDDADAIEEGGFKFLWDAEENPFRSLRPWGQGSCFNRIEALESTEALAENNWWQCVAPPPVP